MKYVFITTGYKLTFYAPDRNEAVKIAFSIADREHAHSWLLFNRQGECIFEQ